MPVNGVIPTNCNGVPSAFGYDLLTDRSEGGNGIIVSTTHKGVLDSATQGGDGFNPIFHNHFITLSTIGLGCPTNADAAVDKITFQSPGRVAYKVRRPYKQGFQIRSQALIPLPINH
jgi:hypothetical protein